MNYRELRKFVLRRFTIPQERFLRRVLRSFTIAEKAILYFFIVVFLISGLVLVFKVNASFLVEVPTRGGTLVEGVIGNPRFINPVLAISEADKNLSALVYSGLVRINAQGEIENDLAEELSLSGDRKTYTVRLREDAHFHDGSPVRAEDVIFTIQKINNPNIKSPRRGNWSGVEVVEIDEKIIAFNLKQVYSPFIYNLAVGILPKHIWRNVSDDEFSFSQFNSLPIGSGPYMVEKVERNSGGIPNLYALSPFSGDNEAPFISHLIFKFFPSEEALIEAYNSGAIDSVGGLSPENLLALREKEALIISSPLPRVFAVFLNTNQSKVLLNKEVRQALDLVSPRKEIIEKVLGGYGRAIDGPFPAGIYPWTANMEEAGQEERLKEALEILAKAGWTKNEETGLLEKKSKSDTMVLSFSISTGDAPELRAVLDELVQAWSKLGAKIEILVFETGDLNQNVIRPRDFEALLFGNVVGRDSDLYPFWHSSQRADPGLNIALYANNQTDKLLESARSAATPKEAEEDYKLFAKELKSDIPAIFLYTPSFIYVVPKSVSNITLNSLTIPQDRFLGIRDWFIETDKVWKIFAN